VGGVVGGRAGRDVDGAVVEVVDGPGRGTEVVVGAGVAGVGPDADG
jgi:hypothetical protein